MSFTSSSKQHVRALTQDDSPGTPSTPSATPTNNDETLSFKEVYDLFVAPGDMSPNSCSLFVAATVKREANASPSTSRSPNHNLLLKRSKAIDLISAGHPEEEKQLQQAAAKAYVLSKQKETSLSSYHKSVITGTTGPRSLNFTNDSSTEIKNKTAEEKTIDEKSRDNTLEKETKPTKSTMQDQTSTDDSSTDILSENNIPTEAQNKKQKRTHTKWSNIKTILESDFDSIRDHLREKYPSLIAKATLQTVENDEVVLKTFVYQCSDKNNERGNCKARIVVLPHTGAASLKVSSDAACKCNNTIRIWKGLDRNTANKVDRLVDNATHLQPQTIKNMVMDELIADGSANTNTASERESVRDKMYRRIAHRKDKNKNNDMHHRNIHFVAHLLSIKSTYTFTPPETCNTELHTEIDLQQFGSIMHDRNQLKVISPPETSHPRAEAYRSMTILDPMPLEDDDGRTLVEDQLYERINTIRSTKKDVEKTEGNFFDTATVFSSLALLWNIKQAQDLDFIVTAAADGTDKMVCNNFQTLIFGVININTSGVKSFRPLFFVLSPGEREEMFEIGVLAFLKYSRLLFGIVNIHFKGGIVSDHTGLYVNSFNLAFPESLPMQCYPHLKRKFLYGEKGNGGYVKHAKNKLYLKRVAAKDVTNLHLCLTRKMFDQYSSMVREAWNEEGENLLAQYFFSSYIDKEHYNSWYCTASGHVGCLPQNQSEERTNLEMKGSKAFDGLCNIGKDMKTMLTHEFPKLIRTLSLTRVGVERHLKIDQKNIILNPQSNTYNNLLNYQSRFNITVDCKIISDDPQTCFIVNTEQYLGALVTDERVALYNSALLGVTEFPSEERESYFDCVASLCIVQRIKAKDGSLKYAGSCSQYYKETYCNHAARFYYESNLTSLACEVPHQRKGNYCVRRENNSPDKKRVLQRKYSKIFDQIYKINATIFHVETTDTEDIVRLKNVVKRFPMVEDLRGKVKSMNKIEVLRCTDLADQSLIVAIDFNFKLLDPRGLLVADTTVLRNATALAHKLKSCLEQL